MHSISRFYQYVSRKAGAVCSRMPVIRKMPPRAVAIIVFLVLVNAGVWVIAGIILSYHDSLIPTAALSWSLGLRHALDADHISAIDLMTRRLIATGQRPVTVGTFFSLGHSTIVIFTSVVVAATTFSITTHFSSLSRVGSIIGTSVSASFLLLLGIMNIYILYKLVRQLQKVVDMETPELEGQGWKIEGAGIMWTLLRWCFRIIDRPWKMYPLGLLFGLGFDTSSEIALLGISSVEAARGTSVWLILLFPVLFTVGMCLLDTIDAALMLTLYTASVKHSELDVGDGTTLQGDPLPFLYTTTILTVMTVLVALSVATLQFLVLALNLAYPDGSSKPFWKGVERASDSYDIIGGGICGAFVLVGLAGWASWHSFERHVARKRSLRTSS